MMHASSDQQACKGVHSLRIHATQFDGLLTPLELRTDAVCLWAVTPSYGIVNNTITPQEEKRAQVTTPLDNPNLFLSFARLGSHGEPSESTILNWVSKYGLLKGRDRLYDSDQGRQRAFIKPEERIVQRPIKVGDFRREVRCASQLLRLYTDVRSRDYGAVAGWFLGPLTLHDPVVSTIVERHLVRWRSVYHDSDKWMLDQGIVTRHDVGEHRMRTAETILFDSLVQTVRSVELSLTDLPIPGEEGPAKLLTARRTLRCPDLLSAIYLQLYLMVTDSKPMRRCENPACGMPFPVTRKGRRFCNATCRSNARHYRSL